MSLYTENGYSSREEYLELLREDYGTILVNNFITKFPPSEDFAGLINSLEEAYYNSAVGVVEDEEEDDEWDGEEDEDE